MRAVNNIPSDADVRTNSAEQNESVWPYDESTVHKTILLGDSGVGKTSFLVQFDTGRFQHGCFAATVGIGFTNRIIKSDGNNVRLQLWDTAGQERFRAITHAYYRDADALLLFYDVTSKVSFDNTRAWLSEIKEYAGQDAVVILIGNKADMDSSRVIRKSDGERLANEYGVTFLETSAKTGQNIEEAFATVAQYLRCKKPVTSNKDDLVRLRSLDVPSTGWSCCTRG